MKAARLLGIPHIPCHNHLLNNEVTAWVNSHTCVKGPLTSVHDTMKKIKTSNKNMAVVRKLCNLCPEVGNETRWTGWGRMMGKYQRMRPNLIEAHDDEDTKFTMNKTAAFKKKAEKVNGCFVDVNVVMISLQIHFYKLKEVRADLDALLAESAGGHGNENSCWYKRKISGAYIQPGSSKLPAPHFVSGVIKIQNNEILQLTQDEKEACQKLVNQDQHQGEEGEEGEEASFVSRFKLRMKKRKAGVLETSKSNPYKNVDFICGSAAEVERLWSICKYILSNVRSRLTPNLFEALIFLKLNRDYWDASSVQVAYDLALKGEQSSKVQSMVNEDEEFAAASDDLN